MSAPAWPPCPTKLSAAPAEAGDDGRPDERPSFASAAAGGQRQPLHEAHGDAQRGEGARPHVHVETLDLIQLPARLPERLLHQGQRIARGLGAAAGVQQRACAQFDGGAFSSVVDAGARQRHGAIVPFNGQGQAQGFHGPDSIACPACRGR